jgi:hypothetical protein
VAWLAEQGALALTPNQKGTTMLHPNTRSMFRRIALVSSLAGLLAGAAGCGADEDQTSNSNSAVAGPAPTGTLTCRGLEMCRSQCKDLDCIIGCDHEATAPAQRLFDAAEACALEHACRDEACVQHNCHDQIAACEAMPAAAASDDSGRLTCRGLKDCRLACGDEGCRQACDRRASAADKMAYETLAGCVAAHGCKDDSCVARACAAEISACR